MYTYNTTVQWAVEIGCACYLSRKGRKGVGGYHPLGDSAWWQIHCTKERTSQTCASICMYYKLLVPFSSLADFFW